MFIYEVIFLQTFDPYRDQDLREGRLDNNNLKLPCFSPKTEKLSLMEKTFFLLKENLPGTSWTGIFNVKHLFSIFLCDFLM